jgi:DNA-binding CsgD family transcriptional regulator
MTQPTLSARELEILQLMVTGYRTSEIAKHLSISFSEAAESCRQIKTKLGVTRISELVSSSTYQDPAGKIES